MIDTLVYDAAGRGGRVAVVTRVGGYAPGPREYDPTAWVFLVVVDGKFEEWRAGDCTTVRPMLPVPVTDQEAPWDKLPPSMHAIGCIRPGCPCVAMKARP